MEKSKVSFKSYAFKRKSDTSAAAKFAIEAKRDKSFPDVRSWRELKTYLAQRDEADQAMIGARSLWTEYQKDKR
jgi:hypothetical protein